MYPLNDNDLDRLSREAAEQYDVDQNTSGWETLENRLNKELPRKEEKERRRFLFWLFFIVLLAGGGVLWTMTGKKPNNLDLTGANTVPAAQTNQQNTGATTSAVASNEPNGKTSTATATPAIPTTADKQTPSSASIQPENKNSLRGESKPAEVPDVQSHHTPTLNNKPAINSTRGKIITANKKAQQDQQLQDGSLINNKVVTRKNNYPTPATDKAYNTNEHNQSLLQEQDPKASRVSWPGIKASALGAIKAPPLTFALNDKTPSQAIPKRKKDNTNNKGFEVALVAGPDMSNVRFTDMDKAGYNVGVQIAYRFSNRWSVNTGFLYTRKNYTAQGKDFTKPNTGWWQSLDLHSVDGYCQMFDIP
ncbi:outer membrane beta-barrel protein [Paraflavitalea speifideaquila]|uniref:outer membrane beta-barrel protein n=1 Tax=Paraflavitalea speifideaquila TaxID=3076558 RepID=UPI0028EAAA58|nr:outer membrane beta-barrel protein [Paraflavitalea speifideiaquila]